jgi:predicted acetyltransferase
MISPAGSPALAGTGIKFLLWYFSDLSRCPLNVRCGGKTGRDMLKLNCSPPDPSRTSELQYVQLVLPATEYKDSFVEAVKEFQAEAESEDRSQRFKKLSVPELESNFGAYVETERSHALGKNLPEGYLPETTYWLVNHGQFLGRVSIRHRLTDRLKEIGGHIGYDIRPSRRRQGYGRKILELALPKAKELGLQKVLITCDATNVGSRRIIEENGGVLENQVSSPETGVDKLRFWVDIR